MIYSGYNKFKFVFFLFISCDKEQREANDALIETSDVDETDSSAYFPMNSSNGLIFYFGIE